MSQDSGALRAVDPSELAPDAATSEPSPAESDPAPAIVDGDLATDLTEALDALTANVARAFLGKGDVVRFAVAALLAGGHLLVEDVPGVGKTTLARALARSIRLPLRRIQFTSDMLPSDIVGVSVYDESTRRFEFHAGPLFNPIVLADEINRASPRTQSALLEAMHEGRVTVENETRPLPEPFFVIATQNPFEFHGTYPLPESQLDRFMLRLSVGYPDPEVERELLATRTRAEPVDALEAVLELGMLRRLMAAVDEVHVDGSLVDYLMAIVRATRAHPRLELGVSTRAALTTMRAARAHAVTCGRGFLLPDDLAALAVPALAHRVRLSGGYTAGGRRDDAERVVREIVDAVPMPS